MSLIARQLAPINQPGDKTMTQATVKKTSEEILGLPKPPPHQCPKIDGFIERAKSIDHDLRQAEKCDEIEEMKSFVSDAAWYSGDIEGNLEELRTAMDELRCCGNEWKDLAKQLINKYEPEMLKTN